MGEKIRVADLHCVLPARGQTRQKRIERLHEIHYCFEAALPEGPEFEDQHADLVAPRLDCLQKRALEQRRVKKCGVLMTGQGAVAWMHWPVRHCDLLGNF